MQTYTHFVMTAFLARRAKKRAAVGLANPNLPPVEPKAALLGSIAPDLPLIALGIGAIAWDAAEGRFGDGENSAEPNPHTRALFRDHFFTSNRVKLVHNLFHAPLLTAGYTLIGYYAWKHGKPWGPKLFAFGLSTLLHTSIDIPIHHDDGPLLLFPFNWELRYRSPVSYWDPKRYGRPFALAEHSMLVMLLIWLARDWRQRSAS